MDQQTKAALKQNELVAVTGSTIDWARDHRRSVILTGSIVLAAIVILVVSVVIYQSRSEAASTAFGEAMQAYQTPIAALGEPVPPGTKTYSNVAERAKVANGLFSQVASKYGWTPDGKLARYFVGLTYIESGQTKSAEDTLKKVGSSWDKELASLANLTLAQLYHDSGRDAQAIDLYNQLAAKPTTTVPSGTAKLLLAELYGDENKPEDARKIYAQLKDKDAKGPAGAIAAEKLNPTPAGAQQE